MNSAVTDDRDGLAAIYRRFAEDEAHGRSQLYEELAHRIATDLSTRAFLASLPRDRQQPNLLFAAIRYLSGTPKGWEQFRDFVCDHPQELSSVMMARRTQTNEPARCATLMPLFAKLRPPLALLEVGAAAGLCLLPDRYEYDYGRQRVSLSSTANPEPPTFSCEVNDATPLPTKPPEVAWRVGLDLDPIDVNDTDQVAWLEALVWPDEKDRLRLLRAALQVARQDPPRVVQGDLRTELPALVAQAPRDATLIVFHTAVLGYVTADERAAFAQTVRDLGVIWISNEAPQCFPQITKKVNEPWPRGHFLLSINGHAIAWTDPHGSRIEWFAPLLPIGTTDQ